MALIQSIEPYVIRKFETRLNIHGTQLTFTFEGCEPTESAVMLYLINKIEKIDYDNHNGDLLFYKRSVRSGFGFMDFWFAIDKSKIPVCEFEIGEYDVAKTSAAIILNAPRLTQNELF